MRNGVAVSKQENSEGSDSLRYRSGPWKTMLFHARNRMDTPMDPIGRIGERTCDTGRPIGTIGVPIGAPETVPEPLRRETRDEFAEALCGRGGDGKWAGGRPRSLLYKFPRPLRWNAEKDTDQGVGAGVADQGFVQQWKQRGLEADDGVDEAKVSRVIHQDIVAVLADIRHEHVFVAEGVAVFQTQAQLPYEAIGYLGVVRPGFRADGVLAVDDPGFAQFLCDSEELETAIGEKDVVHDMLEENVLGGMPFDMEFREWILDFVVKLLVLEEADFAFSRTDRVAGAGDGGQVEETARPLRGGNQRPALPA